AKATITLPATAEPLKDEMPLTLRLVDSRGAEFSIMLKEKTE
ncbi:quinol oxidase, partial [Salmonella enterica subsp. enterica serovar Newport]|nr:quinol oxidase [Salmonella enterica subsp. enterica serovar Newport]